jgi:molybdenum cofactor biosynthesis enzyme MoaA
VSASALVARINLRVLLTEQCNLACVFCHNEGQASTVTQLSMPPEGLARVVRAGRAVADEVVVRLSGGEPTLHPGFLDYLDAAWSAGAAEIVVISNAYRVEPLLGALERSARIRFSVNVPSHDESIYRRMTGGAELDSAVGNIRRLVAAGGTISLNTYWPASRTAADLRQMVEFSAGLGVRLKLLAPCRIASNRARLQSQRHGAHLSDMGFIHCGTSRHVDFYQRRDMMVRVQRPWCPDQCRASWVDEVTFRIRATAELAACLTTEAPSYGNLAHLTQPELIAVLTDAVRRGPWMCATSGPGVPVRRDMVEQLRQAATDENRARASVSPV